MSQSVGIGVVGCGRIARMFHLSALAASPAVRVVAVADSDAEARLAASDLVPDARVVPDVSALLELSDVEGVVVCVPTAAHLEAGAAAFEAGRAAYIEKPLATSLAAALELRDSWQACGQLGAVGFNFRFHPLVRAARDTLDEGRLGQLVGIRTVLCSSPRQLPEWKQRRTTGGGALLDLASHHIDTVRHLTGCEPVEVDAEIRSVRTEGDTAAVQLRLADGVPVQILVSACAAQTDRVELIGDRATMRMDRMGRRRIETDPAGTPDTRADRLQAARRAITEGLAATYDRVRPPGEPSFAAALDAFAAAVRTGRWDGATIDDGVQGLAVVEAAERAARSGRRVTVEAPPGVA